MKRNTAKFDASDDLMLDDLNGEQQNRLIGLLDNYMIRMEEGKPNDVEELLRLNPDLERPLREYIDGLNWLGQFQPRSSLYPKRDAYLPWGEVLPKVVGDFELGEELGRGAMGVVLAATKQSTGQKVAIKLLATHSTTDQNRIERFRREASATQSLSHPNIVKVFEVGYEDGWHYYTMQRIFGPPLSQIIRSSISDSRIDGADSKTFANSNLSTIDDASVVASEGHTDVGGHRLNPSEPKTRPLVRSNEDYRQWAARFADVADALHMAHRSGIVHRDIKPSNLLWDRGLRIMISDFGLAHIERTEQLTRTGDLVGTFHYMSPEQAAGKPYLIDGRSDVYSFGATLYEFFSGRTPFAENTGALLLKQIQFSEPKRLKQIQPSMPSALETIIRRAMRPDRSDRYTTAQDMANDLRRFARGHKIEAKRVTPIERLARYASNHSLSFLLGLAASMIVIAALAFHGWILKREQNRTGQALQLAEKNYHNARQVIDTFGTGFLDRLSAIPGTENVRETMLAESLAYYQAFIHDSIDDPRLIHDVADTRLKIARLVNQNGDNEKAEEAYQTAIVDLEKVVKERPSSASHLNYFHGLREFAVLASERGNGQLARARLSQAGEASELLSSGWEKAEAKALLLNTSAMFAMRSGDVKEAMNMVNDAVKLLRSTHAPEQIAHPASKLQSALVDALSNLSLMLQEAGHLPEAVIAAREAIDRQAASLDTVASPTDTRRLALAYNNLASLEWKQGKTPEAIEAYELAIGLLERVSKQSPGQSTPRLELSVALNNQGMALVSAKDDSQAEQVFRRALALAVMSAEADPQNADAARRTAGIWNNLGVLLRNRYDTIKARHAFEEAMAYQTRSCRLAPEDENAAKALEQIQHNLVSLNKNAK
jgi:eukaryotic-like serine/threonine-protein kinase